MEIAASGLAAKLFCRTGESSVSVPSCCLVKPSLLSCDRDASDVDSVLFDSVNALDASVWLLPFAAVAELACLMAALNAETKRSAILTVSAAVVLLEPLARALAAVARLEMAALY